MIINKERLLKLWEFILIEYHPEYFSMFEYYRLLDYFTVTDTTRARRIGIILRSGDGLLFLVICTNDNLTLFHKYRIHDKQRVIEIYRGDLSISQISQIEKLI